MNAAARRLPWPRTLSARLLLLLLGGLTLAHALSFGLLFYERYQSTRSMMLRNLDEDVAVSVALLERFPPASAKRGCRVWNGEPTAICCARPRPALRRRLIVRGRSPASSMTVCGIDIRCRRGRSRVCPSASKWSCACTTARR